MLFYRGRSRPLRPLSFSSEAAEAGEAFNGYRRVARFYLSANGKSVSLFELPTTAGWEVTAVSRHEIYARDEDIPSGFDTYSILLIPDHDWLHEASDEERLDIFMRFWRFGNAIAEKHMACWFYTDFFYGPKNSEIDISLTAAVPASTTAIDRIAESSYLACGQDGRKASQIKYDVPRARLICSSLGLTYSQGPFVAFFDKKPSLPRYELSNTDEMGGPTARYKIIHNAEATTPTGVLKFGGLHRGRVRDLLDQLEQQLLRDKPEPDSLDWKQRLYQIESWCSTNKDRIIEFIKIVKTFTAKGE